MALRRRVEGRNKPLVRVLQPGDLVLLEEAS